MELTLNRPVVELNLMGYADPNQTGTGLRQRLYSRAFIVGDLHSPDERFIYLVLDTQSGDTAVRHGILQALQELGPDYIMYGQHNVAVTGTHSHSGPGAWLNYLLPQITSKGFDRQSYEAIVSGAVLSIRRAHQDLSSGRLSIGSRRIINATINRSVWAYLANPESERRRYHDDVDKDLTLLRFTRSSDGKDIGVLTWFPVHGTSMFGNNTLITGDNKGVAAYLFEKSVASSPNIASGFVAGFSQSNVGDTSPNVLGAYCEYGPDVGSQCHLEDSTCGGRSEPCHGRGPYWGLDDGGTKSCYEIGRLQFDGAKKLYDTMVTKSRSDTNILIKGRSSVRAFHTFANLSHYKFPHPNGSTVSTCPAALGYSFAAGTTDGPGHFDFKQNNSGKPDASPVWQVVSKFIHKPSAEQISCHGAKPILLDVGETKSPYAWAPNIVDVQLLRVGQVIIIVSPGEATTMAGRRWKEAVHHAAIQSNLLSSPSMASMKSKSTKDTSPFEQGLSKAIQPIVLLGGPANTYTHYITTEEEYAVQRFEGASTLYGPFTLNAYINLTLTNLPFLSSSYRPTLDRPRPKPTVFPPINTNRSLSFIRGVIVDMPELFRSFGDVLEDVHPVYRRNDIARVKFVGANPRNDLRLEGTFAAVEKQVGTEYTRLEESDDIDGEGELRMRKDGTRSDEGRWERVLDDEDWELIYEWKRISTVWGTSEVVISWEIPNDVESGRYRIKYFGDAKSLGGEISSFEGVSGVFTIV